MSDSQFLGWVCVERAFAVFTDFHGVSASTVAPTDVKSLTNGKQCCHSFCPVDRSQLPTPLYLRPTWVRIMSARSPGNSYTEKHWSKWLLSIASFYEFQWDSWSLPGVLLPLQLPSYCNSGWQCWGGQHNSLTADHWTAWVGLSVRREASRCSGKWPAMKQPLRESLESWNPTPHPLCKAPSHRAVNGGKGKKDTLNKYCKVGI